MAEWDGTRKHFKPFFLPSYVIDGTFSEGMRRGEFWVFDAMIDMDKYIFLSDLYLWWCPTIVIMIYNHQRSTKSFIFFSVYGQHVWWLLETKWAIWNRFSPSTPFLCALCSGSVQLTGWCEAFLLWDWLEKWTVRKTFYCFLLSFPMLESCHQTSLSSLFYVLEKRNF